MLVYAREDVPRGETLRRGDQVLMHAQNGEQNSMRVTEISGDRLTLDGNHPLAGQDLVFEIEATQARDATPEELIDFEIVPAPSSLH